MTWPSYKPAIYEPKTLKHKLAYLIEECSEVQKACCKILRFGTFSFNPEKSSRNNWNKLDDEMRDVELAIRIIREHTDAESA